MIRREKKIVSLEKLIFNLFYFRSLVLNAGCDEAKSIKWKRSNKVNKNDNDVSGMDGNKTPVSQLRTLLES